MIGRSFVSKWFAILETNQSAPSVTERCIFGTYVTWKCNRSRKWCVEKTRFVASKGGMWNLMNEEIETLYGALCAENENLSLKPKVASNLRPFVASNCIRHRGRNGPSNCPKLPAMRFQAWPTASSRMQLHCKLHFQRGLHRPQGPPSSCNYIAKCIFIAASIGRELPPFSCNCIVPAFSVRFPSASNGHHFLPTPM